jgi:hypothetical protein
MQNRTRRHAGFNTALAGHDDGQVITLLDYFAAHAPHEIPYWFKPSTPEYDGPAFPKIPEGIPEEDRKMLESWINDDCFDLEGEYAWFQDAVKAYHQARKDYDHLCKTAAYYEWRWEYAQSMMTRRVAIVNESEPS